MTTYKLCDGTVIPLTDCPTMTPCNTPCTEDCGCNPVSIPCPQPFYSEAPAVQQPNCTPGYVCWFYTSLKSKDAWNIPACGSTAVVAFTNLKTALIGGQIWNGLYGYFEVTAFNADTGEVTVKNNCVDGNAAPGTAVPKCAEFIVAPPPCCVGGSEQNALLFPYIAIDFTAQANGACQQITVTSVNGMAVGKNVQIGSGIYRVSSIDSASLITICNDGSGITPGTSVIAKNAAGDYQYPIILIDTNPCSADKVQDGIVLACKDGVTQPLTGLAAGSILTLTNPTTGAAAYSISPNPTFTCAVLTQSLTLQVAQAGYTITVSDSTVFNIGNVLQIGTRSDRFTVTGLPDATHVVGTLAPVPGSIQLIPVGTSICIISCCEALDARADILELVVFNQQARGVTNTSTNTTGTISPGGTTSITSNNAVISLDNVGAVAAHNLFSLVTFEVKATGTGSAVLDAIRVSTELFVDLNGGGFVSFSKDTRYLLEPVGGEDEPAQSDISLVSTRVRLVAPGATDVYTAKATITIEGNAGSTTAFTIFTVKIDAVGVAI